jgi:hypothetical protein
MEACDIEGLIQDTTEHEEPALADLEAEMELVICACGKSFRHNEPGTAALLKKCDSCFSALRMVLGESPTLSPPEDPPVDMPANLTITLSADLPDDPPVDQIADLGPAQPPLTPELILGAMMMAIGDSNKSFTVALNGQNETFTYVADPVNGSKARKMFLRQSWNFAELYWYRVFGAMATTKGVLATPCVVEMKDGGVVILQGILETMCNRPRYDALVYDPEKKEVSIVRKIWELFRSMNITASFDRDELDR